VTNVAPRIDAKPLGLIVAMARNRCIGHEGGLPWHVPEDLKHFREITTGHSVIMGRKTHVSIGKPLPDRRNIVITRQKGLELPGCDIAASFSEALTMARDTDETPIVIGGASIYEIALPQVTRIYVTELDREVEGDTFFPPLVPGEWMQVAFDPGETEGVAFVELDRVKPAGGSVPPVP
jgi:dihydrofolate reductase